MPFAREIFIRIKQVIRFQQSNKEADSHYTLLGNTLVRISNHCTHMKVWDNYFNENPKMKGKPIVSLVFEDNGNTFTEECLFSNGNRRRPLKISEYVFESSQLTKQDINLIIKSLQNLGKSNSFIDLTKRGTSYNRISVCPDFNNIEITNDGLPRKGGIKGTDFVPESKQYDNNNNENKDMKRTNKIRLTESQLHQVIKESVEKILEKANVIDLYNEFQNEEDTLWGDASLFPYMYYQALIGRLDMDYVLQQGPIGTCKHNATDQELFYWFKMYADEFLYALRLGKYDKFLSNDKWVNGIVDLLSYENEDFGIKNELFDRRMLFDKEYAMKHGVDSSAYNVDKRRIDFEKNHPKDYNHNIYSFDDNKLHRYKDRKNSWYGRNKDSFNLKRAMKAADKRPLHRKGSLNRD